VVPRVAGYPCGEVRVKRPRPGLEEKPGLSLGADSRQAQGDLQGWRG